MALNKKQLILILVALLCLAACGKTRKEFTEDGRIRVEFWHGMGGPLGEVLQSMISDFNNSHPTIYVEGVSMGQYETLQRKLLASVVAKQSPDITQNFEALTVRLARTGKLVLFDELLGADADQMKQDIIPVLLDNNTFEGKLWSFPFNKSVPVLYYNKDMFREAGLDPERPPRTLDEVHEYSKKLTKDTNGDGKPDIYGYGFTQRNSWLYECRILQCGGELYNEQTKTVSFDSPAGIRALDFNLRFLREGTGYCVPGFEHQNDFIAQKVAMVEGSIVSRVFMSKKIKFQFGVAPIPGDIKNAVLISGTNINIFNNGSPQRIKAAWEFVKWFTETTQGVRWSLGTTYLPVRKSCLNHPDMLAAFAKDPSVEAPYAQLDYAVFEPRISIWYDCREKLSDALEQSSIEIGDAKTYMTRVTKEINELLQSAEE